MTLGQIRMSVKTVFGQGIDPFGLYDSEITDLAQKKQS